MACWMRAYSRPHWVTSIASEMKQYTLDLGRGALPPKVHRVNSVESRWVGLAVALSLEPLADRIGRTPAVR